LAKAGGFYATGCRGLKGPSTPMCLAFQNSPIQPLLPTSSHVQNIIFES